MINFLNSLGIRGGFCTEGIRKRLQKGGILRLLLLLLLLLALLITTITAANI